MFQHYIYTHAHPTCMCICIVVCKYAHFKACNSFVSPSFAHIHTPHSSAYAHIHSTHTHTHTHTKCLYKVARKQYCPGLCNSKSLIFNLVVLLCYTLLKRPNKAETVLKRIMQYTSHLACCYGNVHVILW